MKKLILSLLTLASLTACKKDIVEPVVNSSDTKINKLPQKIHYSTNISTDSTIFKDTTYYGYFEYNELGLLKSFTRYKSENIYSKEEYEYIGNNVSKITTYQGDSVDTEIFTFENNLFKSYSNSNVEVYDSSKFLQKYNYTYFYKNGEVDYIITKDANNLKVDSIHVSVLNSQIILSGDRNITYTITDSSVVSNLANLFTREVTFVNKSIALQKEVLEWCSPRSSLTNIYTKPLTQLFESKISNKLIYSDLDYKFTYLLDSYGRLNKTVTILESDPPIEFLNKITY